MKFLRKLAPAIFIGGLVSASMLTPAAAAPTNDPAVSDDVFVMSEETAQHYGDRTFYPIPEEYKDALHVTEEVAEDMGIGTVGLLSQRDAVTLEAQLDASTAAGESVNLSSDASGGMEANTGVGTMATSYWTSFLSGGNGNYGPWATRVGQIWGMNEDVRWTPVWSGLPGSNVGQICGQAVGYYLGYNGSQFGRWSAYYGVGCVSGTYSVPWGNIAAYPQFRALNFSIFNGGGRFQ